MKKGGIVVISGLAVGTAAILLARRAEAAPPEGKANLYGIVYDQGGFAIQSARVTLDGRSAYTDAEGIYSFTGLEPGQYTLNSSKEGYESVSGKMVTLVQGDNILNVQMVSIKANLMGKVTNSDTGQPVQGVLVTIQGGESTLTDDDGDYAIVGLTPGTYTIVFSRSGYTSVTR